MLLKKREYVPLLTTDELEARARRSWMKSGLIVLVVIGVVATLQVNRQRGNANETNAMDIARTGSAKVQEKAVGNDISNMGILKQLSNVAADWCPQNLPNIAYDKTADQSSTKVTSRGVYGRADVAVDGDSNDDFWAGSCTHTNKDDHPFWWVDLGAVHDVCRVTITNRAVTGEAWKRLSNFVIFVTNDAPEFGFRASKSDECSSRLHPFTGTLGFDCVKRGRFVGIQLLKEAYLTLCEVKVQGVPAPVTTVPPEPPMTTVSPDCPVPRVRRSWFDLNEDEQNLYISGYKRLYENGRLHHFAEDHRKTVFTKHRHMFFLPWHRYFILQFENQIRALGGKWECFTLPYWDWTRREMGDSIGDNPMFKTGLGGNGADADHCVRDGEFAKGLYITSQGECLKRDWKTRESYATVDEVRKIILYAGDFEKENAKDFRYKAEGTAGHNKAHNKMGGTLVPHGSPNDPFFYLLHSFVDFYWAVRSDCHDFEGTKPVTEAEFPSEYWTQADGYKHTIENGKEARRVPLPYDTLSTKDWWPKEEVMVVDMLRTAKWGYTYDASHFLTRKDGETKLSTCNFNEIYGREETEEELAFWENSDSVEATVFRQMRETPLTVIGDDSVGYCRRSAEKECRLKRAERYRRGLTKRECHYNEAFEKCGGSYWEDGILIISKQELLNKDGVRGNPCLEEVREDYFVWAEVTGTLRELCNGDYDPRCTL